MSIPAAEEWGRMAGALDDGEGEQALIPYQAVQRLGSGPMLVLAPHPDDEVFGCAGAILRQVAAGEPVTVVILTDGGGFYPPGPQRDAYVAQRRQESRAAAAVLGYGEPVFWDYPDRALPEDATLVQQINEMLIATRAHWLYAPSPYELHPDHRRLSRVSLHAARCRGKSIRVAFYEISAPLRPNRLLDISDLRERKRQALACFTSQLAEQAYDRHIEALNAYRTYTLPRTVTAAEAYWVVEAAALWEPLRCYRSQLRADSGTHLTIAIVTYAPDLTVLAVVLQKLKAALHHARCHQHLATARLILVDNGPGADWREPLQSLLEAACLPAMWELLSGQGNVGYGAGHNLAFYRGRGDVHLILNPDVFVEEDALSAGLALLTAFSEIGLLTPAAWDGAGQRLYLCKRYPTVLALSLRGFAPAGLRRWFQRYLENYEWRDQTGEELAWDPPIVSGCFMLVRRTVLEQVGGFDAAYFLYFEDFDLSLRLAKITRLAYAPSMRIVHLGGRTARKGWRHIAHFVKSAGRFFYRHGWRWW